MAGGILLRYMVGIAQSVEHLIVVQKVACSNHVAHPIFCPETGKKKDPPERRAFSYALSRIKPGAREGTRTLMS